MTEEEKKEEEQEEEQAAEAAESSDRSESGKESSDKKPVSSAAANARAAIQAGRAGALANKQRETGQTQAERYQESRIANSPLGRVPTFNEYTASQNPARLPWEVGATPTNLQSPVGRFSTPGEEMRGQYFGEANSFNSAVNYLRSGNTDYETTKALIAQADREIANPNKPTMSDASLTLDWQNLRGYLQDQLRIDNRKAVEALTQQNDKLKADLIQAQNDARVASDSVNSLNFADVIVSDADRQLIEERAATADATTREIYDNQMAVQAQLDQLNSEYRDWFMTPEVEAAMARLSIPQLGKAYSNEDIDSYIASGKAGNSFAGGRKGVAEQMRREDQALVDNWNRGLDLNTQYYNWQDRLGGISKSFGARTLGSAANLAAWGVGATTYDNEEIRQAQQTYDMTARDWLTNQTPETKAAMDAAESALNDAKSRLASGETERTSPAVGLESIANKLDANAQEELAKTKEGLSKGGQFLVDLGSTGLDMGFDALTGTGLSSMFARVAGQGIGEARRAGADYGKQASYGLSQAAIEVMTEKLTDGVGFIYGKGVSTDAVEKAISRLSSSDAGANFLRGLAGVIGEGGEEVISDLLNPFTQWIIDENARDGRVYDVDPSELLYDFLLGGAMGLAGQGVEFANGGYAGKNAEIKAGDAAIFDKAENAEATGQPLSKGELKDLEAAQYRQESAIKGGIQINPNGSLSPYGVRAVLKGKNRHDTSTGVLAEGFETQGYVNSTDPDTDYKTATTGMENRPLSDEEADKQSYDQSLEEEGQRQAEAAAEEEARKAAEEKAAEDARLEEESKRREQEIEGARRAAQAYQEEQDRLLDAAQEAEKFAQLAHNAREFESEQEFIRKAQQARQQAEEAQRKKDEAINMANSQRAAMLGQDTPVSPAPKKTGEVDQQQAQSMAASQNAALESQNQNVTPGPASQAQNQAIAASQTAALQGQEQAAAPAPVQSGTATSQASSQAMAASQAQTIAGQDINPVQAPKNADLATSPETAQGEAQASTQAQTPGSGQASVKLDRNAQSAVSTPVATAEQGKASIESGETNNKTVAEVVPMVDKYVSEQAPVSNVPNNPFAKTGAKAELPLSKKVMQWFKSRFPTGVRSKALGSEPVVISERGIKNDVAHGVGEAKAATFAAVPDVIRGGTIVSRSNGGENGVSVTIAGNVNLAGVPANVYCVLKQADDKSKRFYLHEVTDGNGNLYYQLGQNKNATPALQDSTGANPASADVTSATSIAQPAQSGKTASTNQTKSDIITQESNNPTERGKDKDVYSTLGFGTETTAGGGQESNVSVAERNGLRSGTPEGADAEDAWNKRRETIEKAGDHIIPPNRWGSPVTDIMQWSAKVGSKVQTAFEGNGKLLMAGFTSSKQPGSGIFVAIKSAFVRKVTGGITNGAGTIAVHETVHNKINERKMNGTLAVDCNTMANSALNRSGATKEERSAIMGDILRRYGLRYASRYTDQLSGISSRTWDELTDAARFVLYQSLDGNVKAKLNEDFSNEILAFMASGDSYFGTLEHFTKMVEAARTELVHGKVFAPEDFANIDEMKRAADQWSFDNSKGMLETAYNNGAIDQYTYDKLTQTDGVQLTKEDVDFYSAVNEAREIKQEDGLTGRTSGKKAKTQSAAEKQMATKGEAATTDATMGEAEYISRTNAARSQTADHLTDTQEKADAQVQRLLKDDYVWNDDDVVIAQKLMFDMIKSIRDYQMKRSGKMNESAFRTMTEQYNKLMDKHQKMLSEAGQKLQANYMFSEGDKIIMKAAQTFLGFTKDGRFAGAAPNAKNAKIYAGIEEAVKRISAAIEAKDTQGLAKICKDISNIRNVKKMFGPLGDFADKMENRVLERIAKGENAAANLEKLAYGNLNAVCDDVQPYKPLNAAKTIRVMNMLSNTATIVNNLANNFAQGAVSRSMVNQAFNQLAAKPFEALTGQKVLSKAQRGKAAQKEIHNAKVEALEAATLMQMYGISENNGRLELNDRGMFNPNINAFEQTMSLYRFLTGMGVEATDQMQAAGFLKAMELGIDEDIKAGKIAAHTREQRMQEARHEVNRLLYKDDNETTALVQHVRDWLNKKFSIGNEKTGTIGLGDITMAFAKIPANVVRARLAMTPEGAFLQLAQYVKGVNKAKRMHAEVLANGIVQKHSAELERYRTMLNALYETESSQERTKAIEAVKNKLSAINNQMWAEAREQCRGSVFRNLETIRENYNENMPYDEAVERAGYTNAKEMSQFEAAQLSRKIGRAATSVGMMALGSVLRALGGLRDFDQEPDDELRKMNKDKGYQGLMFNANAIFRPGHEWKDGDLILDGEFLEVIAMPLTIGATAAEAAATAQDAKTWAWLESMAGNGIAKTFEAIGDIPGMADAINMYESMTSAYTTDYDEKTSRLKAGLLNYAANTVPSFFMPNSISQAAAGFDNTVRDVYTADNAWEQAKNIFMNKFPVMRDKIPASVDVWGNERNYGEGLWGAVNKMLLPGDVRVYRKNKYEAEIERLVREGYSNATPKTTVNSSFEVGDEKYTMTAQEKRDYKLGRNQQQKELFESFIDSKYYDQLTDAERMKVFQSLKTSAERDVKQTMLNDRGLDVQITRDKWETELTDVNDQIQFLAAKQMANNVWDRDAEDMDYDALDAYITGTYKNLNSTQRELLDSTYSRLDDLYEARTEYGIKSNMWQKGYDIYKDYTSDEGKARVKGGYKDWEGSQMYTDIAKATGASEKQMDFFEKKFVLYNNNPVTPEKYNAFVDSGWSRESAQSLVKAVSDLTPTNGRKNVSYKQRLTSVATTSGLTEAQRWEAFFEYCPSSYTSIIKKMGRYKANGYSYAKALKAAGKWDQ